MAHGKKTLMPGMKILLASCLLLPACAAFLAFPARAGPPFLTENADVLDFRHFEGYLFSALDRTHDDSTVAAHAFELNCGVLSETQFHLVLPFIRASASGGQVEYGVGDVEVGLYRRLVRESGILPQVTFLPSVAFPSGNPDRGLGNGSTWARLALSAQKGSDPWDTYASIGYVINNSSGSRSHLLGGWALQRRMSDLLMLGCELFARGAADADDRSTLILNAGGGLALADNLSLLFSSGISLAGRDHVVGYLGVYHAW